MDNALNQRITDVVSFLIFSKSALDKRDLAQKLGYNVSSFSQIINGRVPVSEKFIERLLEFAPNINDQWLLKGEGDMLSGNMATIKYEPSATPIEQEAAECYVPMLPLQAIGGALTGFDDSATLDKCERVLSPITDIDFAMEVYGDSMSPEYPSGARIFVKKIDMSAFIEWGRVYVLDTVNGSIVKEVYPSGDTAVECRSVNPLYPPFVVQLKDVRGMYRVLMSMQMK